MPGVGRQRAVCLSLGIAVLSLTSSAAAQDPAGDFPTLGDHHSLRAGLLTPQSYWAQDRSRPFAAATFEGGPLFARATLNLGVGKPHYRWSGLEVRGGMSNRHGLMYAGLHALAPNISTRIGMRYTYATDQGFLPPESQFTREDLETKKFEPSRYIAAEGDISLNLGLPLGHMFLIGSIHYLFAVPPARYVFEHDLRVVMAPPFVWRARAGYSVGLGQHDTMRIGVAGEVIGNPARAMHVVRLGPVLAVEITDHFDLLGAVLLIAHSPDGIGLAGADLGQLGLRYRWATGEAAPDFP
jgi:hypothetical protein